MTTTASRIVFGSPEATAIKEADKRLEARVQNAPRIISAIEERIAALYDEEAEFIEEEELKIARLERLKSNAGESPEIELKIKALKAEIRSARSGFRRTGERISELEREIKEIENLAKEVAHD